MIDPEELITCPYDDNHKIRRKRMQVHIYKCKRQNADKITAVCPFNIKHVVHELELQYHKENCPDKLMFVVEAADSAQETSNFDTNYANGLESWDNEIVESSYNPLNYCLKNDILRQKNAATASERRQFRNLERNRLTNLSKQENGSFHGFGRCRTSFNHSFVNNTDILKNDIKYVNCQNIITNDKFKKLNFQSHGNNEMINNNKANQPIKSDNNKIKNVIVATINETSTCQKSKLEILANLRLAAQKVKMGNNKEK